MKRKILFALIVIIGSIFVRYNSELNSRETMSSLLLANIEALAGDEYYKEFAEKTSDTWQEGPFYDTSGETAREYYWVYTRVDCLGNGVVKCEYDFSAELKYVN